jgi:hypothetical protein
MRVCRRGGGCLRRDRRAGNARILLPASPARCRGTPGWAGSNGAGGDTGLNFGPVLPVTRVTSCDWSKTCSKPKVDEAIRSAAWHHYRASILIPYECDSPTSCTFCVRNDEQFDPKQMLRCLALRGCRPRHQLPALGRQSRSRSVPLPMKFRQQAAH